MGKQERLLFIFEILKRQKYNAPIAELVKVQTNDPFKILVATILSARTKDETTAKVIGQLFKKIDVPQDFDKLSLKELEKIIFQIGFYKNKAKFLKDLPSALSKFDFKVPDNLDDLLTLPGVGRKTANLVLAVGFGKPAIAVDVHVNRIPNRWGVIKTKEPFETEQKLMRMLPKKIWHEFNGIVVAFGQTICKPVGPKCEICPVSEYCDFFSKKYKNFLIFLVVFYNILLTMSS